MNGDLAALARERAARRGQPPPAKLTARHSALSGVANWKLLALGLFAWAALAWSRRAACGCGEEHTLEKTLEGALSGLGRVLSGEESFQGSLDSLGHNMKRAVDNCESRATSAVCHTACWMAGFEVQRAIWWACFKHGRSGERSGAATPEGIFGGKQTRREAGGQGPAVTSWPRLVGKSVDSALERIKSDRPDIENVQLLAADSRAKADFDEGRVRIFHEDGLVARVPRVG